MATQDSIFTPKVLELCNEKDIRVLLNILRLKDPEAYIHSIRTASLMDSVFHASEDILRGTLLHDIGKSVVPFNLTIYPCNLTDTQKKIVDDHTLYGAEMLTDYDDITLTCVLHHHDASYPMEYIQQLRACDVFDALTNDRAYRKACTVEEAENIMLKTGINPLYTNELVLWYNTNVSNTK